MSRPVKVFEPVTNEQIKQLHSAPSSADGAGWSKAMLYEKVAGLIGIQSITALSRQEAAFLLAQLRGDTRARYPEGPVYEDAILGDASRLPSFYHITGIRDMLRELGWDKGQIKAWLRKYRKVSDIRSMDRKQAKATWSVLRKILARAGRAGTEK